MSRERAPHSQLLQNSSGACINWSAVRWNQTAVRKYEQGPRAAVTAILVLLGGMQRWKGAPRRSQ